MAHPYHHAVSSARKWGGEPEDYQPVHDWFDESKAHVPNERHRALRHHAQGIFWCEEVFGTTIKVSTGQNIPVRWIGEQHVIEDMGFIPTLDQWLGGIPLQPWMSRSRKLEKELEREEQQLDATVL